MIAVSTVFTGGRSVAGEQPRFEVASVRRAEGCSMENSVDAGMIALHGDRLRVVLMEAFQVKIDQISGPSWLDSDCFEVIAKIPKGAGKDQIPAMLQALLVERFKLATHKEVRQRAGYSLLVEKTGPKFKEADPNSIGANSGKVRFGAGAAVSGIKGAMTIARLGELLSHRLDGPVQDLTGIKGTYDIDLSWVPDRDLEPMGPYATYQATHPSTTAGGGSDLPASPTANIFSALRDSLGLRLEAHKEPVEMIVIDHIERVPTEN